MKEHGPPLTATYNAAVNDWNLFTTATNAITAGTDNDIGGAGTGNKT